MGICGFVRHVGLIDWIIVEIEGKIECRDRGEIIILVLEFDFLWIFLSSNASVIYYRNLLTYFT